MFSITYSTLNLKGSNVQFYKDVAEVTDEIFFESSSLFADYIESYRQFIGENCIEKLRSKNEYLLELIMLGVLWRSNEVYVKKTPVIVAKALSWLYSIRKRNSTLKPMVDKIRGFLISPLLFNQSKKQLKHNIEEFNRLLTWLDATGEYSEEVKRMKTWLQFAWSMKSIDFSCFIDKIYDFSVLFEERCAKSLSSYTSNVDRFVSKAKVGYKGREDYALAIRKEVEYHLNMVGAEMLNRELKDTFVKAKQKIVLLPTCMRLDSDKACVALDNGFERKCVGCSSNCNVGKVFKSLLPHRVDVYLIPHSSDFKKFLQRWKDNEDMALVGVACVLNLLMGGYEMIELNIASQCIFLDHCGCKKHWDDKGIATSINIEQLHKILDISNSKGVLVNRENQSFVA